MQRELFNNHSIVHLKGRIVYSYKEQEVLHSTVVIHLLRINVLKLGDSYNLHPGVVKELAQEISGLLGFIFKTFWNIDAF